VHELECRNSVLADQAEAAVQLCQPARASPVAPSSILGALTPAPSLVLPMPPMDLACDTCDADDVNPAATLNRAAIIAALDAAILCQAKAEATPRHDASFTPFQLSIPLISEKATPPPLATLSDVHNAALCNASAMIPEAEAAHAYAALALRRPCPPTSSSLQIEAGLVSAPQVCHPQHDRRTFFFFPFITGHARFLAGTTALT
jgi:hypothetical protein